MNATLSNILTGLEALVGFDTQNPPRALTAQSKLFAWLRDALPTFEVEIADLGDGSINFYAWRGEAPTLFNVHLDTVPATDAWTQNPFTLTRGTDRCVGLGACDIKGAAAALIALANSTDAPMALLFTTDEEAGQGRCIRSFVEAGVDHTRVVVAEPTGAKAVLAHRGIVSGALTFKGAGAHASTPLARKSNAVHKAAQWSAEAIELAASGRLDDDYRLNVGVIEGGVKPNVSAPACEVRFGLRPPPGVTAKDAFATFTMFGEIENAEIRFSGPALPSSDGGAAHASADRMQAFAENLGLEIGVPVDFWTEAALFGAGGYQAVVLGPGDIAQAHTANEWVSYNQLLAAYAAYERIVSHDR